MLDIGNECGILQLTSNGKERGRVIPQLPSCAAGPGSRPAPSSRCTMQISLYLEERLTRMITVMEIVKLSSIFEVHRSRFRGGA